MSFHPMLPPVLIRFERNEEYISILSKMVIKFCDGLDEAMGRLGWNVSQ
jgi:hypothetical protein